MVKQKAFLTAEWRKLMMANYVIDPAILTKYLPKHTEIDLWEGKCYVSLVGFLFKNTKLKGIKIPFHSNFEEVNLRFYVKHFDGKEWKRGVVFIKEIVPKFALSLVARTVYREPYETRKMNYLWEEDENLRVVYSWKTENWNSMEVITSKASNPIVEGSEEEFITEHYWGYTKWSEEKTSEYEVEHPRWKVYNLLSYKIEVNFEENYGADFAFLNDTAPASVFLAEGYEICVRGGRKISTK
jgi:uncharacterized protein YqjF (DUF2071 family)